MKRITKRVLAAFLAVVMCLTCACTGAEAPKQENAETKPAAEEGTVKETIVSQLKAYAAQYPELITLPKEEDYVGKDGEIDYDSFFDDYEAWLKARQAKIDEGKKVSPSLKTFYEKTLPVFLEHGEGEKNTVYSPINVYMALAMLAEIVDGDTRTQILDVMGAKDIEEVRETAKTLWLSNYQSDDAVTCLLANSLWLNEDVAFHEEALKTLAEEHFASSYSGKCGSAEMNKALQDWLNENTGGLLEEAAKGIELSVDTVIALASTIYYKASWADQFEKSATQDDIFHSAKGDQTIPFMVQTENYFYVKTENMTVVGLPLTQSGTMYFFLPEEGASAESLPSDPKLLDVLMTTQQKDWARVRIHLPKFDVSSSLDLVEDLKKLGVNDVFTAAKSDFTPLTDVENIEVTQITHAGRVKVDEEGVEAAAFTVMVTEATAYMPEEPIDVVLDRPFVFAVTSFDGTVLFTGVVNTME